MVSRWLATVTNPGVFDHVPRYCIKDHKRVATASFCHRQKTRALWKPISWTCLKSDLQQPSLSQPSTAWLSATNFHALANCQRVASRGSRATSKTGHQANKKGTPFFLGVPLLLIPQNHYNKHLKNGKPLFLIGILSCSRTQNLMRCSIRSGRDCCAQKNEKKQSTNTMMCEKNQVSQQPKDIYHA